MEPTGNQIRLAEEAEVNISGQSREEISTPILLSLTLEKRLAKQGMRVGVEVQCNGKIYTLEEINLNEGFARLRFDNRYLHCSFYFRIKIPKLLKNYVVVPPPPQAA